MQSKSISPCSSLLRDVFPGALCWTSADLYTLMGALISRAQEVTRHGRPARSSVWPLLTLPPWLASLIHHGSLSGVAPEATARPAQSAQRWPLPANPGNGVSMGCSVQIVRRQMRAREEERRWGEEGGGGPRSQLAGG